MQTIFILRTQKKKEKRKKRTSCAYVVVTAGALSLVPLEVPRVRGAGKATGRPDPFPPLRSSFSLHRIKGGVGGTRDGGVLIPRLKSVGPALILSACRAVTHNSSNGITFRPTHGGSLAGDLSQD